MNLRSLDSHERLLWFKTLRLRNCARSFAADVLNGAGSSVQCMFEVNGINIVDDAVGKRVEVTGVEPGQKGPTKARYRPAHV